VLAPLQHCARGGIGPFGGVDVRLMTTAGTTDAVRREFDDTLHVRKQRGRG
jgi:hypothetical protein